MPAERRFWRQEDFSGGMVHRLSRSRLRPNEVDWLENFEIHEAAYAIKRPGVEKINNVALAGAVQGLYEHVLADGTTALVAVAGGTVYRLDPNTDTFNSVGTGLSTAAGTRVFFVPYGDTLILLNRLDAPRKLDLTTDTLSTLGGSPPIAGVGAIYYNHLFLADIPANPNRVYWSETNDIEAGYGGTNYFFEAAAGDRSAVTSLLARQNELIIGRRRSVTNLYGVAPRDFSSPQNQGTYSSEHGVVSRFTLVDVADVPYFLSDAGIFSIHGPGEPVEQSWAIHGLFPDLDPARLGTAMAGWHPTKRQVLFAAGRYSTGTLDLIMVGHVGRGREGRAAWTVWTGINPTVFAVGRDLSQSLRRYLGFGEMIYTGDAAGFVYRTAGSSYADAGTAVTAIARSELVDFGRPDDVKVLREVAAEFEVGSVINPYVCHADDEGSEQTCVQVSHAGALFLTGTGLTGDELGGRTRQRSRVLVAGRAYRHQVEVKSAEAAECRLAGVEAVAYNHRRRQVSA